MCIYTYDRYDYRVFSNSQAQELIVVEEAGQATELRKLKEALEAKVQAARAESEAAKAELLQVTWGLQVHCAVGVSV